MSEDILGVTWDWGVAVFLQTEAMPAVDFPKTHKQAPMAKSNAVAEDQRMASGILCARSCDG